MKILIVDDMKVNRDFLKFVIEREVKDTVFDFAEDGVIAVDKAKKDKYAIIFMDIQMPNLDGFAATTMIREFDAETPIVAVTAFSGKGYEKLCYINGMNGYVAKPFEKNEIKETIQKIMGGGGKNG